MGRMEERSDTTKESRWGRTGGTVPPSPPPSLSLFLSLSLPLFLPLSLPPSLSLFLSPSLSFPLPLPPSLSLSLPPSLSLSLPLFLSTSLSLYLPLFLSFSLPPSLSLSPSLSFSLSLPGRVMLSSVWCCGQEVGGYMSGQAAEGQGRWCKLVEMFSHCSGKRMFTFLF